MSFGCDQDLNSHQLNSFLKKGGWRLKNITAGHQALKRATVFESDLLAGLGAMRVGRIELPCERSNSDCEDKRGLA
jgi:hypothetical protein